jgi:hypothetical protein
MISFSDDLARRPGFKLVDAPLPEWGAIVSMIEFNGVIYVACQFRVLKLVNGKLETVQIVAGHEKPAPYSPYVDGKFVP